MPTFSDLSGRLSLSCDLRLNPLVNLGFHPEGALSTARMNLLGKVPGGHHIVELRARHWDTLEDSLDPYEPSCRWSKLLARCRIRITA